MPNDCNLRYELGLHKEKNVIFIRFDYSSELNERVRKLVGIRWSQSQKSWYVLDTVAYRAKFGLENKPIIGKAACSNIYPINQAALQLYLKTLQLKSYSPSTINTYRNEFAQLLYVMKDKNVDDLSTTRLKDYFLYCINTLKLSENTLHSRINAIKFYFEQVLKREKFFFDIPRPKKKTYFAQCAGN
jgi:integrase/recombinase XerD